MGETEISGGITGLAHAGFKRIESFPTNIRKDEVVIHEVNTKKQIIFLAFYVLDEGEPECKVVHVIEK